MLNKKLRILLYANNLWYLGEGMLGPLFAVFAEKIGGNILDISWAWAVYLLVTGILIVFVGKISDNRKNHKGLMVAGFGLNAILTFAYLLVSTPLHLILIQVGLGIAAALAAPTWYALYSKYQKKNNSGFSWGLADGLAKFIIGVSIILGGLIVTYFSFELLFIIMGVFQVIATIVLLRIFKE